MSNIESGGNVMGCGSSMIIGCDFDFYQLLGISTSASTGEIRSRYRELTRLYHPDKAKDEQERVTNTKLYEKIKLAYQVLSDSNLREEYTKLLQSTFENMKSEYAECPKKVDRMSDSEFDIEKFNKDFLNNWDIGEKTEGFEKMLQSRTNDLDELIKERETINIENRFEKGLQLDKIRAESILIFAQLEESLQKNRDITHSRSDTPVFKSSTERELEALIGQFGYIRDNILENPIVAVDFMLGCQKLNGHNIKFDKDLVDTLTKKLDYQEPESVPTSIGLVPFNESILIHQQHDHDGSILG